MKYILIIGDGMADDPVPELGGKTPLQYAETNTLDMLAGAGSLGLATTIPEGMPAGSDTAILSIFGCDPRKYYAGRAPLEAAATGIKLSPGDIAYRCNLISIEDGCIPFEDKKILSHSAGAIDGDQSDSLVRELFNAPVFKEAANKAGMIIYPGNSFRHIAVKQGDRGCDRGTGSCHTSMTETCPPVTSPSLTPPHDHLGESLGQHLPKNNYNATVLEELIRLSHEFLDDHPINKQRRADGKLPANCIWFWAEGTTIELPNFTEKYGKTGSMISAVPLCRGIGVLIGLEKIIVDGATGELHTNYEGKVDAGISALSTHDFVTIHIEAPDECTHNGDLKGKIQAIEWIDSRIVAPLMNRLNEAGTEYKMLVISDHRTLSSTRGHDSGPVPFILYNSKTADSKKLSKMSYCEENAAKNGFMIEGTELLHLLFK